MQIASRRVRDDGDVTSHVIDMINTHLRPASLENSILKWVVWVLPGTRRSLDSNDFAEIIKYATSPRSHIGLGPL